MPREVKLLGLSAILIVAVGATYVGGSAFLESRERHAVQSLLSNSMPNQILQFGRFRAFGHEYCQEVIIGTARKAMRVGPVA